MNILAIKKNVWKLLPKDSDKPYRCYHDDPMRDFSPLPQCWRSIRQGPSLGLTFSRMLGKSLAALVVGERIRCTILGIFCEAEIASDLPCSVSLPAHRAPPPRRAPPQLLPCKDLTMFCATTVFYDVILHYRRIHVCLLLFFSE